MMIGSYKKFNDNFLGVLWLILSVFCRSELIFISVESMFSNASKSGNIVNLPLKAWIEIDSEEVFNYWMSWYIFRSVEELVYSGGKELTNFLYKFLLKFKNFLNFFDKISILSIQYWFN